jgi:tRNA/rRNA methyltransferase
MLSPEELDRICIVLVRARNPNNIGAAARAMHDFGLSHLRVVNDYPVPFESARSAVDANDVLADAVVHATLAESVADCTLVVGTTSVGERDLQHPLLALADAAPRLREELRRRTGNSGRAALLFGSEKTGLSNEELSHCNWLLTIPMHPHEGVRHASMNLGQAVAVCLYEMVREEPGQARDESATQKPSDNSAEQTVAEPAVAAEVVVESAAESATAADLERLTTLLYETLEKSGYLRRHPAHCEPMHLRRLLRRMVADAGDAAIWTGIFRQLLWKLRRFS